MSFHSVLIYFFPAFTMAFTSSRLFSALHLDSPLLCSQIFLSSLHTDLLLFSFANYLSPFWERYWCAGERSENMPSFRKGNVSAALAINKNTLSY